MKELRTVLFCHATAELYGADYVLLQLVKQMRGTRFRPVVVLPFRGPLCDEFEKEGIEFRIFEMPVLRRQYFTPWGIAVFGWRFLRSIFWLLRISRKESVDIFHTNTAAVWSGGIVAKLVGKQHIWQVMELVEKPRIVAWLMGKMVGWFASEVFCISEAVRQHFLQFHRAKADTYHTLYHGVDTKAYRPDPVARNAIRQRLGIPKESVLVTYAGRFSAWKGQDVFAKAIPLALEKASADLRFLMIGSTFMGQEHHEVALQKQIESLPTGRDRVTLSGFQKNLPDWLAASDIFVLPSKLPEPNATVLIGAMATGLPCIGTKIGGTAETIVDGKTGLLIPPDDAASLANAMATLADNPSQRSSMGSAGLLRATTVFTLDNYCNTIIQAYER